MIYFPNSYGYFPTKTLPTSLVGVAHVGCVMRFISSGEGVANTAGATNPQPVFAALDLKTPLSVLGRKQRQLIGPNKLDRFRTFHFGLVLGTRIQWAAHFSSGRFHN